MRKGNFGEGNSNLRFETQALVAAGFKPFLPQGSQRREHIGGRVQCQPRQHMIRCAGRVVRLASNQFARAMPCKFGLDDFGFFINKVGEKRIKRGICARKIAGGGTTAHFIQHSLHLGVQVAGQFV